MLEIEEEEEEEALHLSQFSLQRVLFQEKYVHVKAV